MKTFYIKLNKLNILANVFIWALYFISTLPPLLGYSAIVVYPIKGWLVNTLFLAGIFYGNYYLMIPWVLRWFKSYAIFMGLLVSTALIVLLRMLIDHYYYSGFYVNGQPFSQFPIRLLSTGSFLLLSTVLAVLEHTETRKQAEYELLNEKLQVEMSYLKLQINPHFLFNVLNNIYTLSYLKDEKTPLVIMKLSEILRYMLYECKEDKVLLQKEIHILENYIELQKLKSDRQEEFKFTKSNIRPEQKIAPLILINFIENAFKHSHWGSRKGAWINVSIAVNEKYELQFNVKNTVGKILSEKNDTWGVGLANAKKQLEFGYPGKHSLSIKKDENTYEVKLEIKL